MTTREKNLALAVGLCAPLILGYFAWSWYTSAYADRSAKLQAATKQLELLKAKQQYTKAEAAVREEWKRDSLPDNKDTGMNQFQLWLGSIANKHQLTSAGVIGQYIGETPGVAKKFKFTMDAQGSLEQLAKFLEEFARVDRLQEIRNLVIEPDKSGKLKINLIAEALAVVGNKNSSLPAELRTSLGTLDAAKGLASRNFFAEYVPPPLVRKETPPPPPPKDPPLDLGKVTYVTAVIENNGEPEIWLYHRIQDKTEHLRAGDSFELGDQRGKVVSIDVPSQSVDLEIGNRKRRVVFGNSLASNSSSSSGGAANGSSSEGSSSRGSGEGNSGRGFSDGNSSSRPSGGGFGFGKGGSSSGRDSRGSSSGGDSRRSFRPPGSN